MEAVLLLTVELITEDVVVVVDIAVIVLITVLVVAADTVLVIVAKTVVVNTVVVLEVVTVLVAIVEVVGPGGVFPVTSRNATRPSYKPPPMSFVQKTPV